MKKSGIQAPVLQDRDMTLDFVRGIAVFLVVLGHSIQYGSGQDYLSSGAFYDSFLFKLIYSFHMPLFAMVSGYVLFWSVKKSGVVLVMRRIQTLLLPVLGWSVVSQVYQAIRHVCLGEMEMAFNRIDGLLSRAFYFNLVNCFWFMWAVFWCGLIVIVVEKVLRGSLLAYLVILAATLVAPSSMDLYSYMYPYFVLGFLWNKNRRDFNSSGKYLIGGIVLFVILLLCYNRDIYVYLTGLTLLGNNPPLWQFGVDLYRWIIGLVGSVVVMLGIRQLDINRWRDRRLTQTVCWLGQNSLGIYMVNTVFGIEILPVLTENIRPGMLLWILETVVLLILTWPLLVLIKKIPLVRLLLLGRN